MKINNPLWRCVETDYNVTLVISNTEVVLNELMDDKISPDRDLCIAIIHLLYINFISIDPQ